jgi:DNA-binding transcriptional regulator YbjK
MSGFRVQTYNMSRPQRSLLPVAESRRRAILDATLRVAAAGGIDAVTHRRVAAEAGVALGSTTYYFRSRDEMLLEAFRQYIAHINAMITSLAEEFPQGGLASFLDLLVAFTQRQFQNSALLLAEYELNLFAARNPELAAEYSAWQRAVVSLVAERLEELGAERPIDAGRTFVAAVRGFELERLARPEQSLEEFRRRLEVLLRALLPAQSRPANRQRLKRAAGRGAAGRTSRNRVGAQSGSGVRAHDHRSRTRVSTTLSGDRRVRPAAPRR